MSGIGLASGLRRYLKDRERVVALIQAVETLAHRTDLHITAQALNRAKNAAGWELAANFTKATAAAIGLPPVAKKRRGGRSK